MTNEQLRLQQSVFLGTEKDALGNIKGRLLIPQTVIDQTNRYRTATALMNETVHAASMELVNMGKNMQWTGRQLTVGLTLPIVAVTAAVGLMAYNVNKEMGRLRGVYGDATTSTAELNQVSKDTMNTAKEMASQFGVAAKETVGLAGDFAAAGYKQQDLQDITKQTTKLMVLGETSRQEAFQATISLMNAFHVQTSDLSDVINHLNAVENQTVLTTQDIITAIPRASGAVAALGGNYKDLVVILTAFKAAGISAATGAVTLTRALTSIISPTSKASKELESLGINVSDIVAQNEHNGQRDIVGMMTDLAKSLDGLPEPVRLKAIVDLFGKFQTSRIAGMLDQLANKTGAVGDQVSQALAAVGMSSAQAAAVSQKELDQRFGTASMRIKKAVASIGADMAAAGQPVLSWFATVIGWVDKLVKAFNAIPGPIKHLMLLPLLLIAVVGPITMVTGLFLNLIGTTGKLATMIFRLFNSTNLLNKEELINNLTMSKTGQIMNNTADMSARLEVLSATLAEGFKEMAIAAGVEGEALDSLTARFAALNTMEKEEMETMTMRQRLMSLFPSSAQRRGATERDVVSTPQPTRNVFAVSPSGEAEQIKQARDVWAVSPSGEVSKVVEETKQAEKETSFLKEHWKGVGASALFSAGMVGQMAGQTKGVSGEIFKWALYAGMLVPVLQLITMLIKRAAATELGVSLLKGVKGLVTSIPGISKLTGILGGAEAGAEGAGAGIAGIGVSAAAIVAPVALAAAAIGGVYLIHRHQLDEIKKQQENISRGAEDMAKIVGAAWGSVDGATHTVIQDMQTVQEEQKKAADKAAAAAVLPWKAAADQFKKTNNDYVNYIKQGNDAGEKMQRAMALGFEGILHGWKPEQALQAVRAALTAAGQTGLAWQVSIRSFQFTNAKQAIQAGVQSLQGTLDQLLRRNLITVDASIQTKVKIARGQAGDLDQTTKDALADMGKKIGDTLANMAPEDATQYLNQLSKAFDEQGANIMGEVDFTPAQKALLGQWQIDSKSIESAALGLAHMSDESFNKFLSSQNTADKARFSNLRAQGKEYDTLIDKIGTELNLDDKQKKQLHSIWDLIKLITGATGGEADAVDSVAQAWTGVGGAVQAALAAGDMSFVTDFRNNLKSAAQSYVNDAMKSYDTDTQNMMDNLNKQEQAAQDSYDKREKTSDDYYDKLIKQLDQQTEDQKKKAGDQADAQVKNIKDVQAAQDDAEKKREAMFQAEQNRLQRLAEMQNSTISFATAFNSGNLDEAAKAASEVTSKQSQYAMEDADARAKDRADSIKKAQDDHIQAIEDQKQATLDAIDKESQARKDALQKQKDMNKQALEDEKKRNQQAYEDRKQSLQKQRDSHKEELQNELNDFLAQEPRTLAEYQKMYEQIAAKMGITQHEADRLAAKDYHDSILSAGLSVANDKAWNDYGQRIAAQATQGSLGMSWNDFVSWMETGKVPVHPAKVHGGTKGEMVAHTGGRIPDDGPHRGLNRDETPIIAQHGEWVIQKSAVNKYGHATLDAINRGVAPKFHEGGPIAGVAMGAFASSIAMTLANAIPTAINIGAINRDAANVKAGLPSIFGTLGDIGDILSKVLSGLKEVESGNNYTEHSNPGYATGAYQYEKGTWNDYAGYSEAYMAPPNVQDTKARNDMTNKYHQYKDWEEAIASWLYPAWAGDRSKWNDPVPGGNPTLNQYVSRVEKAAGLTHAELEGAPGPSGGSGKFSRTGVWPPAQLGIISPNTAAAQAFIAKTWPDTHGGGSPDLSRSLSDKGSDHPWGKALDVFPGTTLGNRAGGDHLQEGNAITSWFIENPHRFGTKYLIWQGQIDSGGGWEPYTRYGPNPSTTLGHFDHVHLSFLHGGGPVNIPSLRNGGVNVKYDNLLANLHKNETVLTAPLSKSLEEGINGLDTPSHVEYNITVTTSSNASPDDIARAIALKMKKEEMRVDRKRKISA